MNRLSESLSPYLLQHADNPVDWYEWGEEAFRKAREEEKPVFLSIGYATCHWCHVMAHESFEDEEVAALLNEHFVSIKLDREERPDIDAFYMTVCQATTGHGGWPLTVFLTPEQEPFYVGTYFPKRGRGNRPGMTELLPAVARSWNEGREKVLQAAANLTAAVNESLSRRNEDGERADEHTVNAAFNGLATRFDAEHGGFGGAPKFPTPHNLLFLLREHHRRRDALPLRIVRETLLKMRMGGIWDHVGFGFHRYSTDEVWKLPHFEKMLYDQALLAMAYTEGWHAIGDPLFRQTAEEIIAYVDRELTGPDGAFFSAEDADSRNPEGEMEEGAFYVWTWEELAEALAEDDAALTIALFNVEEEGNFHDESTRQLTGANVLHLNEPLHASAERLGMEEGELERRVEDVRRSLFTRRLNRERPLLDDKVLTDWNGLMIAALAKAGWTFDEPVYVDRAARAARFVLDNLRTDDGRLLHRFRAGQAGITGLSSDYAFLAWGVLELHQATFETGWLTIALEITDALLEHFWDDHTGSLFITASDAERLPVRQREFYDGAIPSANSVAAHVMIRLAHLTGRTELEERAERILNASADITDFPTGHTMAMMALQLLTEPPREVVIAPGEDTATAAPMLSVLREHYQPDVVAHLRHDDDRELMELAPFVEAQGPREGRPLAYVCERFACRQPVEDAEALRRQLVGAGLSEAG